MKHARTLTAIAAAAVSLSLLLSGCSSSANDQAPNERSAAEQPAPAETQWPRTVEIPAHPGGEASLLRVAAEPRRIAALDYESAEVLAALGLAERVVLVPEAVQNPVLGGHTEQYTEVERTFPVAMEVEAETVISLQPDLVVMSARHGNEAPIATVLQQAGVAVLRLPASWISPGTVFSNIELIGQATGAESRAQALTAELEAGLAAAGSSTTSPSNPRVLVLTNQAGRPFVTAGEAYPIELLTLAGAQNAAAELGVDRTGPITAEQVVESNPDGIVLIDMNGTGDRMFSELLSNAAVALVPAVAEGRILRIEGRQVQALGLTATVDGLETMTEWVATLPEAATD